MNIKELAELIGIVLGTLGLFAAGVGTVIYGVKRTERQERKDLTETADTISNFWKNQAEELKEILATKDSEFNIKLAAVTREFNEKIQDLVKEIGMLKGQLSAEKAINERLEKIFQNRSPEMEAFMKYMVEATEKHNETHEAMMKVLTDLHAKSFPNNKTKSFKIKTGSIT
jgi:biopolymer transport protein ExbB/TolQ